MQVQYSLLRLYREFCIPKSPKRCIQIRDFSQLFANNVCIREIFRFIDTFQKKDKLVSCQEYETICNWKGKRHLGKLGLRAEKRL